MNDGLVIQALHAQLGDFYLKDVNLDIPKGSICGLVGRSGAGKTTLIKAINGGRFVNGGDVYLDHKTLKDDEISLRTSMSTVYDFYNLNPFTKPKSLLKTYRKFHPRFNESLFETFRKELDLELNKSFKNLSLGMQKKVLIAFSLAVEPNLLLLDEPTIGIDVVDKAKIYNMVQSFMENEDKIVLFSSHQIEDVERISDYIAFIHQGRIVYFGNKETLLSSFVYCKLDRDDPRSSTLVSPRKTEYSVEGVILKKDAVKAKLNHQPANLEQIFMHLCGEASS